MKKNILFVSLLMLSIKLTYAQTIDTLVAVGSYKLHFHIIKGNGLPILFEAGGGDNGVVWKDLLKPLFTITGATIIAYDRAGFGQSGLDTNRYGIVNGILGLEAGLKKLGYDKDIMLVGHSLGGFYATLYAYRNPQKVKTVVLIDASHASFYNEKRTQATQASNNRDMVELKNKNLGVYYIYRNLTAAVNTMRKSPFPVTIPVVDIVSDRPPFQTVDDINDWKAAHRKFAAAESNREGIVAYGTGHYVFIDNPSLVIEAIVSEYAKVSMESLRPAIYQRGVQYAIEAANAEKKHDEAYQHSEDDLNSWGYELIHAEKKDAALEVFKLNVKLHPSSSNVYDSLAEIYEGLGNKIEAITNYKRAAELDPKNTNAQAHLKKLLQ